MLGFRAPLWTRGLQEGYSIRVLSTVHIAPRRGHSRLPGLYIGFPVCISICGLPAGHQCSHESLQEQ